PRRPGWPPAPLGEIPAAEVTPRRFLWRRHAGADGGGQRPDQNRPTSDGGSAGSKIQTYCRSTGGLGRRSPTQALAQSELAAVFAVCGRRTALCRCFENGRLAGCGKTRRLEKIAQKSARN